MPLNESIISNLKQSIEEIEQSINRSCKQAFNQNEKKVLDLNRKQMFEGTKSDDTLILPPYADSTVKLKIKKLQPYDRVTLKDTGAFYDNLLLSVNDNEVIFKVSSVLQYPLYLLSRYNSSFNNGLGSNLLDKNPGSILGLNTTNKTTFLNENILPILKQNINDIIAKS